MAKISIVIVDDEVLVRQGIKSYIESADEDMEIAGTFSNAGDAIEFLRSHSVQILITDIKMAQMSGVELISHCVRCLCPMGIIVLSCYDSFEYAREVFALGADAYILKDEVTQPQLIAEIKKAYVRLRSTAHGHGETGALTAPDAAAGPGRPCVVARICFRLKYERFMPLSMNADGKIVFDVASEVVDSHAVGRLMKHNGEMLLCIDREDAADAEEMRERVALAARQLYANLLNYFNERVYLSVSDVRAAQDFSDAVRQAASAADMAFYDNESVLFFFSDRGGAAPESNGAFYARRIELPSREWYDGFRADLDAYFAWARQVVLPPRKLIKNMHGFLYKLEDHLMTYYGISFAELGL